MSEQSKTRAALGGASHGLSGAATAAGGCASTSDIVIQTAQNRQIDRVPIMGPEGKIVAVIVGDTLTKTIDGWPHMLHNPVAIAIDAGAVAQAERLGVTQIAVTDRTSGRVYSCMMRDFLAYSWRLDRGCGLQAAMRISHWHTDDEPTSEAAPTKPAKPVARQMELGL